MLANILAVGLIGTAMALSPMQPRYVVDNQNDTLTFSAEELNNNTYEYLAEQLISKSENSDFMTYIHTTSITYNKNTYQLDDISGDELSYLYQNNFITFGEYQWWYIEDGTINNFTAEMTINDAEWFIANIEEPPSLTLSKYDLNNKKYTYLAEQINNVDESNVPREIQDTTITYNVNTYAFDEYISEEYITYTYIDENQKRYNIELNLDKTSQDFGKWQLYTVNELSEYIYEPFTASMTINNAQWLLDNINAPLDSGDMMTAITSGLPLMANLAQAFLNGFTSIFWNSTTNTLTTFSNFALIMLSVAIVFACIKLVLNVVRSNTGV